MKMQTDFASMFYEEEKVYLNKFMEREALNKLSKEEMIEHLDFAYAVIDRGNDMLVELIQGVKSKISSIREDVWSDFLESFPIPSVGMEFEEH